MLQQKDVIIDHVLTLPTEIDDIGRGVRVLKILMNICVATFLRNVLGGKSYLMSEFLEASMSSALYITFEERDTGVAASVPPVTRVD